MGDLPPVDGHGGSMFITQRAQVSGQKVQKTVKLPRIDGAKGVEAVTQSSQSTELLLANKEMAAVQEKLEAKKVEFNERMAKCKEKEELLGMRVSKLKAEEAKFQLFLKENDAKRERALKRAREEIKIRNEKEKEAEQLRQEMAEIEQKLVVSKANLEAGLVYQHYLEKVVEHSEDFTEIPDILKRYLTLSATNTDLLDMVSANVTESEASRLALTQVSKQLQNELLVHSSMIAEHQERLDKAKIQMVIEEAAKETREDASKNGIRELGAGRMATFNLYNRCRNTHMAESRPKGEAKDVMAALRYVEERFRDLAQIVKEGLEEGLIGLIKVREAVIDKQVGQATYTKAAGGTGEQGAKHQPRIPGKPPTGLGKGPAQLTKGSSSFVGSGSGSKTQPALQ